MNSNKKQTGWHVISSDRKLRYDDNRLVKVGESLSIKGIPTICKYGMHASTNAVGALNYSFLCAPQDRYLCRVEVHAHANQKIQYKDCGFLRESKFVGNRRKCIAMWDCYKSPVIRKFIKKLKEKVQEADPGPKRRLTPLFYSGCYLENITYFYRGCSQLLTKKKLGPRNLSRLIITTYPSAMLALDKSSWGKPLYQAREHYQEEANKLLEDMLLADLKKRKVRRAKRKAKRKQK